MSFGSIPVILSDLLVLPEIGIDYNDFCIIWKESEIEQLYSFLKNMHNEKIIRMRNKCIEYYKLFFSHEKLNYSINYYYRNKINYYK
jgi:hypothetical protein